MRQIRKAESSNTFLRSSAKISMKSNIQNLIKDLISQKFRVNEREWYLNQTIDQINIYLD